MQNIITNDIMDKQINSWFIELRNACKYYHRGIITIDEVNRTFNIVFSEAMGKFFSRNGFKLTNGYKEWLRFYDDYNIWKNGEIPTSSKGKTWLSYNNEEADYRDKEQFFKMMEAFQVPIEYYEPYPPDIIRDDYRSGHYPGEMIIGCDIWEDDGGLLSDSFQLGSTITLTDHYGLNSEIKIKEHRLPKKYKVLDEYKLYDESFIGTGTIEGYTSSNETEMRIDIYEGRVWSITFFPQSEDWEAHDAFPLWEKEVELSKKRDKLHEDVMNKLLLRFMHETA